MVSVPYFGETTNRIKMYLSKGPHALYHLEHQEVIYEQILVFQPLQRPQATSIGQILLKWLRCCEQILTWFTLCDLPFWRSKFWAINKAREESWGQKACRRAASLMARENKILIYMTVHAYKYLYHYIKQWYKCNKWLSGVQHLNDMRFQSIHTSTVKGQVHFFTLKHWRLGQRFH